MAKIFSAPSPSIDPLELKVNSLFDGIVDKVNERRVSLLTELRERREESRARDTQREEMISQIAFTKSQVESGLKENPLKQMQQELIAKMEKELKKIKMDPQKRRLHFSINSNYFEEAIESLGEFTEEDIVQIDYSAFKPVIAVAKKGESTGELSGPGGLEIDKTTGNIYITEYFFSRISIFSKTGDFINCFGAGLVKRPWGIAIDKENLYVSDVSLNVLFHFKLPDMKLVQRVGKEGTGEKEFQSPQQISISDIGDVYVCDSKNDRIQVLSSDLKFKSFFTHEAMLHPADVKLTEDLMYVLSDTDNPCVHIFTLTGEKIRSIISRGEGEQITKALFFCIDSIENIIISDYSDGSIKVFSSEGEFLHQIGRIGYGRGMFSNPRGVSVTEEGKVICVSNNVNFGLQIFS